MHTTIHRRRLLQGTAAALALPAWMQAQASNGFPSKPLKIIQPLPSGGAADSASRLLATAMEGPLGQAVMVENKPGGAFMVAMNTLKSAPADGYTLISLNAGMLATQAVYGQFDIFKELVPIVGTGETDVTFTTSGKQPFKTIRQLIDYGRANQGRLIYASPGPGTLEHLALANLCTRYGIEAIHVPVKGGPDMLKMVLQGDADLCTLAVPLVQQFLGSDRIRPLVVLNEKRNPAIPDVPTYTEEKLDVQRLTLWGGLAAPAGTPKDVLDVLQKAALVAAAKPELQQKIAAAGMIPAALPAVAFGKLWQDDYAWISKSAAAAKATLTR